MEVSVLRAIATLDSRPRYWRITRDRRDLKELELEIGWLTIPEPLLPTP